MKLRHESINLFNPYGAKRDIEPVQVTMKVSKDSSDSLNLPIRNLPALFMIEQVLLIDLGQIDLVVRLMQGLRDSPI
jgi:hypothetical protein